MRCEFLQSRSSSRILADIVPDDVQSRPLMLHLSEKDFGLFTMGASLTGKDLKADCDCRGYTFGENWPGTDSDPQPDQ
jgi:hypothetical protein